MEARHTIKIDTNALRLLRMIAAYTGRKQHEVIAQLLDDKWRRVERELGVKHTAQKGS